MTDSWTDMQTKSETNSKHPDSLCVDLSLEIGYPLSIYVNNPGHTQPLFWQSWSNNDLLEDSTFLQAPGLPIAMLLSNEQLNHIPKQALEMAMSVPGKQYQLLQGMLISSASMELALSNPLLFMLLVDHAQKHNLNEQTFRALVLEKRTEILRYLQLPHTASVVKMLARIDLKLVYFADLKSITEVLNETRFLDILRHAKQPCINHFLFLQRYRGLFWSGLLNMITPQASVADMGSIQRLAQDSCSLGANLNNLRFVLTVAELKNLHDRLIIKHNRMSIELRARQHQQRYGDFPKPPLPGSDIIIPISSWYELAREGLHMSHCVGSYHQQVYQGSVFIYQVLTEQRITLSLTPQGTDWIISEARCYANAPPPEAAMVLIHNWLSAANKKNQHKNKVS